MNIDFGEFLAIIEKELQNPLPGFGAYKKLSSSHRLISEIKPNENTRESAVLILFYKDNDTIYLPLIQRAWYDGTHGGQMAFPGGKKEESDESLVRTAIRETQEEIGVKAIDVKVIGELSTIFIPPSNFWVKPILAYIDYKPDFFVDSREVDQVVPIKIHDLIGNKNIIEKNITIKGQEILTPGYEFEDKWVWGATALMLSELNEIISKHY